MSGHIDMTGWGGETAAGGTGDVFSGRHCVVTGGLGFIGSNLALALANLGATVTVIDAQVPRHGGNVHNLVAEHGREPDSSVAVINADIADVADGAVRRAVVSADFVFNLAGQVSHVDSMTDPVFDLQINTTSQFAFLELLRRENADAVVVFTSTRQVFGKPRYLPVDEDHPVAPVDVNGITKFATEQLHLLYHEVYGLRSAVIRVTNVFGPRQRLRDNFQGFLPIFVRRALLDEALLVFGDGLQERDCLYVDDVVECLLRAASMVDAPGGVFIIGNDEHLTVRAIAESIVGVAGSGRVEFVAWPADRDAIDTGSYFGDSSKAKRLLGWQPHTGFDEAIERTIRFYRARRAWYL